MATLTAPHGVDLTDWFARHVPDGATVLVEPALPGETHEAGVHIVDKRGLRVRFLADGDRPHVVQRTDGAAAPIPAVSGIATSWPRKRVALGISGDHDDVRLYGPHIQGGNPYAGLSDQAYRADLEGQHGIQVLGGRACVVKDAVVRDVFADFFYVGGAARDVILCGYDFDRNGRQGLSATAVDGLLVCGGRMDNVRRTCFDLEPPAAGMALVCTPPAGARRQNWKLANVTATKPAGTPSGAAMVFTRVDGVTVTGCNIALAPNRGMTIAKTVDCTAVTVK
jgi:hypothetical protein